MVSRPQSEQELNTLKVELIQADLETAIDFARLALYSDDVREIIRYKGKACDVYEEALDSLATATLKDLERVSIKTKVEHLESVLKVLNENS
jgi:hypothetical protein